MTKAEVSKKYIDFLQQGDTNSLLQLFTKDALVVSPLYGTLKANEFYVLLSNDTTNSELTFKKIFNDPSDNDIALYFNYIWTLKSNKQVSFDVVDIIEFDEFNSIKKLTIIYDTVNARKLLENLKE